MQPVLGLGTPDSGDGRREWEKVVSTPYPTPYQSPLPTPSVLDAMEGMAVDAHVTGTIVAEAEAFSSPSTSTSSATASVPVPSPELLGLFGYAIDVAASIGYPSAPVTVPSSLQCAVGGSTETVIGGL